MVCGVEASGDSTFICTSKEALTELQHFQSPFYCEVREVLDEDHQIQVHEGEWGRIYFIAYDNESYQLKDVLGSVDIYI